MTYGYTPNGKQEYVIDANGNRAQFTYDGFDRKSGWYLPSKTAPTGFDDSTQARALATAGTISGADQETYEYDAAGNLLTRYLRNSTPAAPVKITYAYDNLNRLQSKTLPTGNPNLNSVYAYDLLGRLQSVTSSNTANLYSTATSYTYDGLGRMMLETKTLNGVAHATANEYDAAGNRTKLTWVGSPSFYVTYKYDFANRMTDINEGDTTNLVRFVYDEFGRRKTMTRANGTSTEYGYDAVSRLNSLQLWTGATLNNQTTFLYTPASQISQKTQKDAYAWTGAVAANTTYTPNGLNQIGPIYSATTGTTVTATYDPKGNLTNAGGATYAYNAENELATQVVTVNGTQTTYRFYYDPMHRLIYNGQENLRFEYDGDKLATEYDSSGTNVLRRYVFGPGVDEPLVWYEGSGTSDKRWLAADAQGSVVSVTNASGTALAINSYDEYGLAASTVDLTNPALAGRFRYTGQQWLKDLGMYYYKARIYSPTLGRFMQWDPIGYKDQINLYTYVGDDPVNHTDPTGNETGTFANGCMGDSCMNIDPGGKVHRAALWGMVGVASLFVGPEVLGIRFGAAVTVRVGNALFKAGEAASTRLAENAITKAANATLSGLAKGEGRVIAGNGSKDALRAGESLAKKYGGEAGDYQKVSSGTIAESSNGAKVEVHAYRNVETGKIYEPKIKVQGGPQ